MRKRKKLEEIFKKYPFLIINDDYDEYLSPDYYNKILKEYSFNGKSDLDIFVEWLTLNIDTSKKQSFLELGCGSGRVTDETLKVLKNNYDLNLLDLSNQMLKYCKNKYKDNERINYIKSDTIKYLKETSKKYDIVYSLWSYSHSLHQILPNMGFVKGKKYIAESLKKFIKENLNSDGKIYIIHFDSMSDEQKILVKEWGRLYEIFKDNSKQSNSLIITDEILNDLKREGIIDYKIEHLIGDEIEYSDMNDALETFLNFHMESEFNNLDILPEVIEDLISYFNNFKTVEGKIRIRPGCFVITVEKK